MPALHLPVFAVAFSCASLLASASLPACLLNLLRLRRTCCRRRAAPCLALRACGSTRNAFDRGRRAFLALEDGLAGRQKGGELLALSSPAPLPWRGGRGAAGGRLYPADEDAEQYAYRGGLLLRAALSPAGALSSATPGKAALLAKFLAADIRGRLSPALPACEHRVRGTCGERILRNKHASVGVNSTRANKRMPCLVYVLLIKHTIRRFHGCISLLPRLSACLLFSARGTLRALHPSLPPWRTDGAGRHACLGVIDICWRRTIFLPLPPATFCPAINASGLLRRGITSCRKTVSATVKARMAR